MLLKMSYVDIEQRPTKKRRFFVDEPELPDASPPSEPARQNDDGALPDTSPSIRTRESSVDGAHLPSSQTDLSTNYNTTPKVGKSNDGFDKNLLESFVGQSIPSETLEKLHVISGGNVERAINMYFDGSWKEGVSSALSRSRADVVINTRAEASLQIPSRSEPIDKQQLVLSRPSKQLDNMPNYRYVGAFGVAAWATRSGIGLVKHGEVVRIERTKSQPRMKTGRGGRSVPVAKNYQRTDVIVRFTNTRGEEVGRLPKDAAEWVSVLIDQKVCHFEGHCVFAPDRIRINDTIYLQLRCSILRKAFEEGNLIQPLDNNRKTGIFEEKESLEEKDLRLRQVALVRLFQEINLHPTTLNETTAKHKREGLLQAAEMAEGYDKEDEKKRSKNIDDGNSTPSGDEEPEDGKELEQDQLDALYKKAQSFDFNAPTAEPAESFVMNLRKYQKQALFWLMSKEKDEKSEGKELSMHPLWEEYTWPVKDVDDKDLPTVLNQGSFYVNPYSGELSLDFPVQEQHCLGGILADEMGLGKTIGEFHPMIAGCHRPRHASKSLPASLC